MRHLCFFLIAFFVIPAQAKEAPASAPEVDLETMVQIDEGGFNMGLPFVEMQPYGDGWFIDQTPEHYVSLSAFYIDKTEVTVGEFALFLNMSGGDAYHHPHQPIIKKEMQYKPIKANQNEPIRQVTWYAADAYCRWAGKRLPTEAEHEYAAGGAQERGYAWGDSGATCAVVNLFSGQSYCHGKVREVGSYPQGATPEGLMEMTGNVAEWVSDFYGAYEQDSDSDPTGPQKGDLKVIRGGSFLDAYAWQKTTARYSAHPKTRSEAVGFRCVYTDSLEDDAKRGALSAANSANETHLIPAVKQSGDVVGEGLVQPLGLTVMDGVFYVTEKNVGQIASVESSGAISVIADGFESVYGIANDGTDLYVADKTAGTLTRVSLTGAKSLVASELVEPEQVVADANHVYFADATTLYRADTTNLEVSSWVEGLDGIQHLLLSNGNIYFVEAGNSNPSNARIVRVNTVSGIENTVVANSPAIGSYFLPKAIAVDASSGAIHFPLQFRNWPWYAFPCNVSGSGGIMSCDGYSPPQPVDMVLLNGTLYWGTRFTMTQFTPGEDTTFSHTLSSARPGEMLTYEDAVYWVDQVDGRLYRHVPEAD